MRRNEPYNEVKTEQKSRHAMSTRTTTDELTPKEGFPAEDIAQADIASGRGKDGAGGREEDAAAASASASESTGQSGAQEQVPMVITIGREYGSGGREIGEVLARRLGIAYYDKELLRKVSERSGLAAETVESFDERPLAFTFFNPNRFFAGTYDETVPGQIHVTEVELVQALVAEGPCVMVGRCIDSMLEGRENVVRLFVSAPLPERIKRVMRRNNLSEEDALARIKRVDKERASYYRYMSDRKWGLASNYDLCINSASTGIEGAIDVIEGYLEATGLSVERKR